MKTRPQPKPFHTEESYAGLSEVCKRLSKSQDFRTLGDELSGHDSVMVMAGLKQAAGLLQPSRAAAPTNLKSVQTPERPKRKVKVIRDADGAITGFESE